MELQVIYDKKLMHHVAWVDVKNCIRTRRFGFLVLLLLALWCYQIYFLGWPVTCIGTIAMASAPLAALFVALTVRYFVTVRQGCKVLRLLDHPCFTFVFSEDGVAVSSAISQANIKWSQFCALYRAPAVWVLNFADQNYYSLPTAQLTDEMKAFIEARCRANGIKIKGA